MIKSLTIKNIGCFYEETKLDFLAANYEYKNHFIKKNNNVSYINPMAVYGRNSSGKTTLLRALVDLYNLTTYDLKDKVVFFYPNIDQGLEKESMIKVELIIENQIYIYEIKGNKVDCITYESLKCNEIIIIENKEENKSGISLLRQLGREQTNEAVTRVYEYICNINYINCDKEITGSIRNYNKNKRIFEEFKSYKEKLKLLDELPIVELLYKDDLENNHKLDVKINNFTGDFKMLVSRGTRNTYDMLSILEKAKPNSLLVIDEFENSMHPILIEKLIEFYNEVYSVQLIFSTHNTNLMKALRPDQIVLVKQMDDNHLRSKLIKLSEIPNIKIRDSHNIEKLYYGGTFDEF